MLCSCQDIQAQLELVLGVRTPTTSLMKTTRRCLCVGSRHLDVTQYAALVPGQKVNHFPGSLELGRKDKLCTNILRMQRKFTGAFYQIIPETFVTGAKECKPFMAALASSSKALWILKPPNQCCGRGIKIISGGSDYTYEPDKRYVAQVTSFDPLRVYLFDNGLVRFCTHNKAAFQSNQDAAADGEGSKWSYQALQAYFETQGLDPTAIHLDIAALIVKTLVCVESPLVASLNKQAKHVNACFELFGFDVLLDANLRPWLLEVNVFPSMSSSSPMDKRIKSILVCDTFQLVGVAAVDMGAGDLKKSTPKPRRSVKPNHQDSTESSVTAEDIETQWIQALEDEASRLGHFERIFPTPDTIKFLDFFEIPRPGNLVYAKHLQMKTTTPNQLDGGRPSKGMPNAAVSAKPTTRQRSFSRKFSHAKTASLSYNE
ncbi:hypothetical protein B5M09_007991 [Aphanomyces astaci]|uniref:ATP-grasp domain-containing protein n=1 Tax=Aphanomyces astaci TaxID=112090 RepID=A0A425DH65_APHAT|nr:hypothetical protein B5M09_007991 [Aphanomyces astaci]